MAFPESLYPETDAMKWHFPQENANCFDLREDTETPDSL